MSLIIFISFQLYKFSHIYYCEYIRNNIFQILLNRSTGTPRILYQSADVQNKTYIQSFVVLPDRFDVFWAFALSLYIYIALFHSKCYFRQQNKNLNEILPVSLNGHGVSLCHSLQPGNVNICNHLFTVRLRM